MTCPVGEQQRAALAKVLLREPQILPAGRANQGSGQRVQGELRRNFEAAHRPGRVRHSGQPRCGVLCRLRGPVRPVLDGGIVAEDAPVPFFSGKSFLHHRRQPHGRRLLPEVFTAEDVITACGGRLPLETRAPVPPPPSPPRQARLSPVAPVAKHPGRPVRRRSPGSFLLCPPGPGPEGSVCGWEHWRRTLHTAVYAVLLICLAILALAVSRKESPGEGGCFSGASCPNGPS